MELNGDILSNRNIKLIDSYEPNTLPWITKHRKSVSKLNHVKMFTP